MDLYENLTQHVPPAAAKGIVIVLGVLVQINETGGDDQVLGAEHPLSDERVGRDASDPAIADADVPRRVEAGFGIHDASAFNDEVVLLGKCGGGRCPGQRKKEQRKKPS